MQQEIQMYKTTEFDLAKMFDWNRINKGGQAEVWSATLQWLHSWGPSSEKYAIKFFNNPFDYYNEHFATCFLGNRDVSLQKIGTGIENELADYSLLDWLQTHNTWNEETVLIIIAQILRCLNVVHNRYTIHLDIKPSNILISKKRIILGDFGLAIQYYGQPVQMSKFRGTPNYQAPESRETGLYTPSNDFYSLGKTIMDFVRYQTSPDYCYEWFFPTNGRPDIPASDDFVYFVTGLIAPDIESRYGSNLGVEELFGHRVFNKINVNTADRFDIV